MRRWVGALLLAGGAALAQDDAARAQLEQRIRLNARLLSDSPTAQRIASSGNVQAQAGSHANEVRLATLDLAHVDRMLHAPGDGPLLRSALLDRNPKAYELRFR